MLGKFCDSADASSRRSICLDVANAIQEIARQEESEVPEIRIDIGYSIGLSTIHSNDLITEKPGKFIMATRTRKGEKPNPIWVSLYAELIRHRVIPAWILWACAMMANALVGVVLQHHVNVSKIHVGPVLYDLGFEFLPYIPTKSYGFSIPDLCALVSATLIGVCLVLTFPPSLSVILLRRILLISALAYIGRAISVPLTLLPNPDPDCVPNLDKNSILSSVVLIPFGVTMTCSDCFYSGHALPISCALFTWIDYMRSHRIRPIGIIVSIISLLGIIATHFHYTVDVFYGFLATAIIWRAYHFALCCPSVLFYFPSIMWWESMDAMGDNLTCSDGVKELNFSQDPRLVWSYTNPPPMTTKDRHSGLSNTQILLLVLLALTLSPSWIAIYQGSQR